MKKQRNFLMHLLSNLLVFGWIEDAVNYIRENWESEVREIVAGVTVAMLILISMIGITVLSIGYSWWFVFITIPVIYILIMIVKTLNERGILK